MRGRRYITRGVSPAGRRIMSEWLIAIPVWGDRYLDILERATLPALRLALAKLGQSATLVVHTDQPERVTKAAEGLTLKLYDVPGPDNAFESLSQAHRHVLQMAQAEQRVCLLTADLVMSSQMLFSCEELFKHGKSLVCCMGMRVDDAVMPPNTESGHELLAWGWEHRHPMTRESTWPNGRSYDVWRMYFEQGDEVACRLSLPHPIALVKKRNARIQFYPTIDVNVTHNFSPGVTHLIIEPHEGALIELSPQDKEFIYTESMLDRLEKGLPSCPAFVRFTNPRHRGFFQKQIIIKGSGGDCGDQRVMDRVMRGT